MQTRILTTVERLRRERGWSQTRLAQLTGIPQVYISLLERSKYVPAPEEWEQLARAFGVSVAALQGVEQVTP
jgi:transcriptional regulator with XRE-family HTH domain